MLVKRRAVDVTKAIERGDEEKFKDMVNSGWPWHPDNFHSIVATQKVSFLKCISKYKLPQNFGFLLGENGSLETVKYFCENFPVKKHFEGIAAGAIYADKIDILKYIEDEKLIVKGPKKEPLCPPNVKTGGVESMKWLIAFGFKMVFLWETLIDSGNIELMEFVFQLSPLTSIEWGSPMMRGSNLRSFVWLSARTIVLYTKEQAAENGHLHILLWMIVRTDTSNYPEKIISDPHAIKSDICKYVSVDEARRLSAISLKKGHMNIIEYFESIGFEIAGSRRVDYMPLDLKMNFPEKKSPHMALWFMKNGGRVHGCGYVVTIGKKNFSIKNVKVEMSNPEAILRDSDKFYELDNKMKLAIVVLAAENGRFEIVKTLSLRGHWSPAVITAAIEKGHEEIAGWAVERKCPIDEKVIEAAAKHNNKNLIKKFIADGYVIPQKAVEASIKHGALDVFKIFAERAIYWRYEYYELAVKNNHFNISRFMEKTYLV